MKKVLEWYNVLHAADALDFEVAEEEAKETEEEPAKAATARPQHLLPPDRSQQNRPA